MSTKCSSNPSRDPIPLKAEEGETMQYVYTAVIQAFVSWVKRWINLRSVVLLNFEAFLEKSKLMHQLDDFTHKP
jgi:hypothetical protein